MLKAQKIIILGIVQGVGFRPFIYRIAYKSGVKGYVRNLGGSEVEIHIEGLEEDIEEFHRLLREKLPPVALIHDIRIRDTEVQGYNGFEILPSLKKSVLRSIVPPDFSVCGECIDEVDNPNSRWYRYPFNSCAYCGPRYSIMQDIPYDRDKTSMVDFPLCDKCRSEYEDPDNIRRFHAQGISCPECGPKIWLVDADGRLIQCRDPISEAAKLINEGNILSVKGIGGFHIAALASEDDVVIELRKRKKRPEKPFAIMARDLEVLDKLVYLNEDAIHLLNTPQHPILLLPKKDSRYVSRYIAPGLAHLGVFLPYTPLHHILLGEIRDGFAIMTSGNPPGEPMCIKNDEAVKKLRGIVDYHLLHNRRIVNRVDDSVLRFTYDKVSMLRRGRGYAPYWLILGSELNREVIAFGAMLQNAGGVGFEDKAVLTQYIGDCDDFRTLLDLKIYLRRLSRLYRVDPKKAIVAVDLHPGYPTMRLAEEWAEKHGSDIIRIQHHWAHIASVMAEHRIDGEIVGIAIDGTGYGIDGNIWGGEVLLASYEKFKRIGHIQYFPMPGGDAAAYYPYRILAGILSQFLSEEELTRFMERRRLLEKAGRKPDELNAVLRQIQLGRPLSSSLGRVLDAASVLLDIAHIRTYEGEPAMKLEAASTPGEIFLEAPIIHGDDTWKIDITALFRDLLMYIDEGFDKNLLAYNIQWSLGKALAEIALKYARNSIVVSGGAAVNTIIIKAISQKCREKGVRLLTNDNVPPGDGGIALGQITIAGRMPLS